MRGLWEFGATITFVSNIPGETQTLSAAIYTFLQIPNGSQWLETHRNFNSYFIISNLLSEIILEKILRKDKESA